MIKDPDVALAVSETVQSVYRQLDESARLVRERCDAEDVSAYIGAVGTVLCEMIFKVMEPLYIDHPSLAPSGWNRDMLAPDSGQA